MRSSSQSLFPKELGKGFHLYPFRNNPPKGVLRKGGVDRGILQPNINSGLFLDHIDPDTMGNLTAFGFFCLDLDRTCLFDQIFKLRNLSCVGPFLKGNEEEEFAIPIDRIEQTHPQRMVTKESQLVRLLIEEISVQKKAHLLTISHGVNSHRSLGLKRFDRREAFENFGNGILDGGWRDDYFLGTPPQNHCQKQGQEKMDERFSDHLKKLLYRSFSFPFPFPLNPWLLV